MGAETKRDVWADPRKGDRVFYTAPSGRRWCHAVDKVTGADVYVSTWVRDGRGWRMNIACNLGRITRSVWCGSGRVRPITHDAKVLVRRVRA